MMSGTLIVVSNLSNKLYCREYEIGLCDSTMTTRPNLESKIYLLSNVELMSGIFGVKPHLQKGFCDSK